MSPQIPLGERESQRLEFKSAEALKQPEKIAREVVGMLNAEGGEVWVGLREEDGRAVEIEPIESAESRKERLLDHLVDVLVPSPISGELEIEVVALPEATPQEGRLLVVHCRPQEGRRPYAWIDRGWSFVVRVDARLRPMEREEVRRHFVAAPSAGGDEEKGIERAQAQIVSERDELRAQQESLLWLAVEPARPLGLGISPQLVKELLEDPAETGNRRSGWNFLRSRKPPSWSGERVVWGGESAEYRLHGEIRLSGGARFELSLAALEWKGEPLWPLSLLEYPISGLRLLSELYRRVDGKSAPPFVVDLALFAVGDRTLHPGSPRQPFYGMPHRGQGLARGDDAIADHPLVFTADEILNEPDRCGFRLVRRIYRAFGLDEDAIPREYDRERGRLILPE